MLRLFILGVILIPVWVACSSDDFENPSNTNTDAWADSASETGVGGSEGGEPDAAEAEAGPLTWPVHLEVTESPTSGGTLHVLSSLEDGTVHSVVPLHPSGAMDVDVVDRGSIHLLVKHSTIEGGTAFVGRYVYSLYGVASARTFTLPLGYVPSGPTIGDITFYPDGTFPGGTTSVLVTVPCASTKGNTGNPYAGIPFNGLTACPNATEYWAAALALNSAGKAISAQLLEHLPVASSPTTIYISFGTPATYSNRKTTFSPAPVDAETLGATVVTGLSDPAYGQYGDQAIWAKSWAASGANGVVELPVVTGSFPEFLVRDTVGWAATAGALQRLSSRTSIQSSLSDTAWDPTEVARFETLSQLDVTELARPEVSWTLESTGSVGACIETIGLWDATGESSVWVSMLDAGASGSARFPALPDELGEFALAAGQTVHGTIAHHYGLASGECGSSTTDQRTLESVAQNADP